MRVIVIPSKLKGKLKMVPSKSFAHRILICAALSENKTNIYNLERSQDIEATMQCLKRLGASFEEMGRGVSVTPIDKEKIEKGLELDCYESGSTLRFLLPIAAVLTGNIRMRGRGRLPERPILELVDALKEHGKSFDKPTLPFEMTGEALAGEFEIPGNISSQYVSGLLMALPLLKEDSKIILSTELESLPYVGMTIEVLKQFGIKIEKKDNKFEIKGRQQFTTPGEIEVEGDWSNAAFFYSANCLGNEVSISGLRNDSIQGDRQITSILRYLLQERNALQPRVVDLTNVPDLLPPLAVVAANIPGETIFTGAKKLRYKESDRLAACCKLINGLGGKARETEDGIVIIGTQLKAGTVDGCNDHRIVMAATIAGLCSEEKIVIEGAQAVKKSYPTFFEEIQRLGGVLEME